MVARVIHPAHKPGIVLSPKHIPEYEMFLKLQGRDEGEPAAWVHLAARQVKPVMIRRNETQVRLRAVIRGCHGPLEIAIVNQVARNWSRLIGTHAAIGGRHIYNNLPRLQKRG